MKKFILHFDSKIWSDFCVGCEAETLDEAVKLADELKITANGIEFIFREAVEVDELTPAS